MAVKGMFNVPFSQMRDYINAKKAVMPSETWQGIDFTAHSHAFAITGAVKLEFLHDVKKSIEDAANNGTGYSQWKKQFRAAVKKHGGDREINTKPGGAETLPEAGNPHVPLLSKWRQRVIYETNMNTAYAAGKYERLTDNMEGLPYWQFVHGYERKPEVARDEHAAWDGVVYPANHEWWAAHYPPFFGGNFAFGCSCGVKALTKREAENSGRIAEKIPESGDYPKAELFPSPVSGVFKSAERFREREPELYSDFMKDYIKNVVDYCVQNNYIDGVEKASKNILEVWNERHYANKATKTGDKEVALPVVMLSEKRLEEINEVFRTGLKVLKKTDVKNANKIKIRNFTKNPLVTIAEERYEHAVRSEKNHDTPPKDAYRKLAEVLKKGALKFSMIYRNGKEGILVIYDNIAIAVNGNGQIVTFYEKKK